MACHLALQLTGADDVREGPGPANDQGPPGELPSLETVAFGGNQGVPPDAVIPPLRAQHAAAAEQFHQLVGGIRNPGHTGLPVAHRALADLQQICTSFDP